MSTRSVPFAPTYEEVIWERTTESRISTVISLLPMSLQSRMSPFKSRRTASLGSLTTDGRLVCTSASTPSLPSEKPRSGFPGWGLTMRRSSGMVSGDGSTTPSLSDGEEAFSSGAVTPMREIALRPGSEPRDAGAGSPSGIRWKVANQGTNLIGMAAEAGPEGQTADFERRAFVDGVTYLLRGLPPNLDVYETEQIKAALPVQLNIAMEKERRRPEQVEGAQALSNDRHAGTQYPNQDRRSLVHRAVQLLVANLFLAIHFALPYLVFLIKSAATVERRYKVSETVVGHGMNLAGAAGRQCSQLAGAVLNMNDGKVGQGLSRAVAWTVEEVTRGISDGVGEGLVMTRLK